MRRFNTAGPCRPDLHYMIPAARRLPEAPGLGINVDETECVKHPYAPEVLHTTNGVLEDGTIVDW